MRRILLISNRNLYNTSGELRLVKHRTETLMRVYRVGTDVVLLKNKKVLKKTHETIDACSFKLFPHVAFDYWVEKSRMMDYVTSLINGAEQPYAAIIVSGALLLPLVSQLKALSPNISLIADLHGAYEELIEFTSSSFIMNQMRHFYYWLAKRYEKRYLKVFDGYFTVSRALKNYIEFEYKIKDKPFFLIPCGLVEQSIDIQSSQESRCRYRAKYGFEESDIVFVYSGGVSPWQCIRESVIMFKKLQEKTRVSLKLLLLSGNLDAIKDYQSDSIIVDSYSGNEVREVLCAGDYAFMLRQDKVTNRVAYPNKFLEYVYSGMQIITTSAVYDAVAQIKEFGIGIIIPQNGQLPISLVENRKPYLQDIDSRNTLLKSTSFETTLAPFVDYLAS